MTAALLGFVEQRLADRLSALGRDGLVASPEHAFITYVLRQQPGATARLPTHEQLARAGWRFESSPSIAAAGFRMAAGSSLEPTLAAALREGLARLAGRNALPSDRQSFFFRPTELLGVAFAAGTLDSHEPSEAKAWVRDLIERGSDKLDTADGWTGILLARARLAVGLSLGIQPPADGGSSVLLAWLLSEIPDAGLVPTSWGIDEAELYAAALERALLDDLPLADGAREAVALVVSRATASRWANSQALAESASMRDPVQVVLGLCRRFHLFALQAQRRHAGRSTIEMTDEHDAQDALHAILRLHFADVRAEEWTPSYAATASRMDFILVAESIVIEVKMTRKSLSQREVVLELTEDKERYRRHQGWRTLICFIYDPALWLRNPDAIERDVSEEFDGRRVIAVVAPQGT